MTNVEESNLGAFYDSLTNVRDRDAAAISVKALAQLVEIAHIGTSHARTQDIIPDPLVVQRPQKVGEYFSAMRRAEGGSCSSRGIMVHVVEVSHPPPAKPKANWYSVGLGSPGLAKTSNIDVLNRFGRLRRPPPMTIIALVATYPRN